MERIKKNDEVIVITGKDKGKRGRVSEVAGDRILVENVNIVKKTVRPDPNQNETGGIKEQGAMIHISNVMLFNSEIGKGDRVGFRVAEEGSKTRYFKSTKKDIA